MKYTSQAKLAKAVKRSGAAISKHKRRPDWPVSPNPPWTEGDVETVRLWLEGLDNRHVKDRSCDVQQAYKQEQTLLTRARRLLIESQYVDREIHEAAMIALTEVFVEVMDSLAASLPLSIEGLEAVEAEQVIVASIRDARTQIAEEGSIKLSRSLTENESRKGRISLDDLPSTRIGDKQADASS